MSRINLKHDTHVTRFPRVSGDEPPDADRPDNHPEFSPRERG